MPGTEVNETPVAGRISTALDGIIKSPVSHANLQKILDAAQLLDIDHTKYSLDNISALGAAMYEKAAPLLKDLTAREVTGADIESLQNARRIAAGLEAINCQTGQAPAVTQQITAKQILDGYKNDEGRVTFTLPEGMKIGEGENPVDVAGKILNAAASAKGIGAVFYEGNAEFWKKNEADPTLRTVPGEEYGLTIDLASLRKNRAQQLNDHGPGVPDGAIALAEACERLTTGNQGTLFKDADGNKIWVRGLTPGVALDSLSDVGVRVFGHYDDNGSNFVAFASRAASRNLKTA